MIYIFPFLLAQKKRTHDLSEQLAHNQKQDRPRKATLIASFGFAAAGLWHMLRTQRNFQIQLGCAAAAIAGAFYLQLAAAEWALLILTITGVLVLEILNTVIESVVDLVSPDYHPLAKIAKDTAAGAVLLASLAAVIIGVILMTQHL